MKLKKLTSEIDSTKEVISNIKPEKSELDIMIDHHDNDADSNDIEEIKNIDKKKVVININSTTAPPEPKI